MDAKAIKSLKVELGISDDNQVTLEKTITTILNNKTRNGDVVRLSHAQVNTYKSINDFVENGFEYIQGRLLGEGVVKQTTQSDNKNIVSLRAEYHMWCKAMAEKGLLTCQDINGNSTFVIEDLNKDRRVPSLNLKNIDKKLALPK
tara:strand:+ start:528 stop:962 length:435 start_codon:yes stop_codon:yes gene_type:complete